MSAWTQDRIRRLKTLWEEGRSAAFIAVELGPDVSRSAVLGKIHRLKLTSGRRAPSLRTVAPPKSGDRVWAPRARLPAASVPIEPPPQGGSRTILTVRRFECRWPFGDPRHAEFSLCGAGVARGAFCGSHAAIAYRSAPATLESLIRLAAVS